MIQGNYLRETLFSTSEMAQLVLRMLPSFYLNDREMDLQLIEGMPSDAVLAWSRLLIFS